MVSLIWSVSNIQFEAITLTLDSTKGNMYNFQANLVGYGAENLR